MKNKIGSIFISLIMFILGLFLVIWSSKVTDIISIIVGIVLVCVGLYSSITTFKKEERAFTDYFIAGYGVISIVAGTILIINPVFIQQIISFVIGIYVVAIAISKLQESLALKTIGSNKYVTPLIFAIIELICGVLCIFGKFLVGDLIIEFIGVMLMIYAVMDIANSITVETTKSKKDKLISHDEKKNIKDAIVEDVK